MKNKRNENKDINKNHSRVSLSGIFNACCSRVVQKQQSVEDLGLQISGMAPLFDDSVRAFTLIELLVVVLIIGILAAIALPQYEKAVEKVRMTEGIIMVKKIAEAQERFKLANGRWATFGEFDALDIDMPGSNTHIHGDQNRPILKYFYCTNQGSINEVNCQRLPGYLYYIYITEDAPNRLRCDSYNNATAIQAKLCAQLNDNGTL